VIRKTCGGQPGTKLPVQDEALRFENMVAVELNRAVTLWTDFGFGEYQLWFLRNKEKQEVDFLVTENAQPLFMVEAKFSDKDKK
jgi:predicted AAA+ superfamily ATPase